MLFFNVFFVFIYNNRRFWYNTPDSYKDTQYKRGYNPNVFTDFKSCKDNQHKRGEYIFCHDSFITRMKLFILPISFSLKTEGNWEMAIVFPDCYCRTLLSMYDTHQTFIIFSFGKNTFIIFSRRKSWVAILNLSSQLHLQVCLEI